MTIEKTTKKQTLASLLAALAFILVLAPAAFPQAQRPQPATPAAAPQPPGTLAGKVLNANSKEPLRKVTLALQPQGTAGYPLNAISDKDGNFLFTSIEPGIYLLRGERVGFVTGTYGVDQPQTPIQIKPNETKTGIEFRLIPQSVINGKVFDSDGDPVGNANVSVSRYSYPRGEKQLVRVANTNTDDTGAYRIPNLSPGRYYVSATESTAADFPPGGPGRGGPGGGGPGGPPQGGRGFGRGTVNTAAEVSMTTFYPSALDPSSSSVLDMAAGGEANGVDIRLRKSQIYRVSGVVEGLPAATQQITQQAQQSQQVQPQGQGRGRGGRGNFNPPNFPDNGNNGPAFQPQGFVNLTPQGGQLPGFDVGSGTQVRADGSFELTGVRPGSYYLTADTGGPPDGSARLSARVPVEVRNSSVTGLRVRLSAPFEVSGTIHTDPANMTLNLQQVRVGFTNQNGQGFGGGGGRGGPGGPGGRGGPNQPGLDDQGKFRAQLDAGTYQVVLQQAPNNVYLKAVKIRERTIENNLLDLNSGVADLEVILAGDAAALTGKVEASKGKPASNARVTVVPANTSRRDLFRSTSSTVDGTFTIQGLPPGTYQVFAWLDVDQNAWMDADYRKPYENQSTSVEIRDGRAPALTLPLIKPSQEDVASKDAPQQSAAPAANR